MLYGNLGPVQRVDALFIGKAEVALVSHLEARFDVLAYIEVLVVAEVHSGGRA